jgi:hypothetical protein
MMSGFKIVCRFDDALDAEAMGEDGIRKYRETADFSEVKIREGKTPAVFHCRRLKSSEMQAAMSHTSEADRNAACFARGLMRAENLYREHGRADWVRSDSDRPIGSKAMDECFDYADVQEVGSAIYGQSLVGKGRPAVWPLPATSRDAVMALVHLHAELTRESDAARRLNKSEVAAPAPDPQS